MIVIDMDIPEERTDMRIFKDGSVTIPIGHKPWVKILQAKEIVCCADCKHFREHCTSDDGAALGECTNPDCPVFIGGEVTGDWFCANSERKEVPA